MFRFAEICAGISLKVSENLKAYILQAIAANEGTDCRLVLNSKEIERFSVAMRMKISLRAAFAYLLQCCSTQCAVLLAHLSRRLTGELIG